MTLRGLRRIEMSENKQITTMQNALEDIRALAEREGQLYFADLAEAALRRAHELRVAAEAGR